MEIKKSLRLSVHQLVDFLLRTGDLDNRIYNKDTMAAGTQLHLQYQKKQSGDYQSEYFLSHTYETDDHMITLEGRADGIIEENGKVIVEEVKTTIADLNIYADANERWHVMQAACYGHMYAYEEGFEKIEVRLIYISQVDNKIIYRKHQFLINELEQEILGLLAEYLSFYRLIEDLKQKRNGSLKNLSFPFVKFREGQRELAKYVFGIARNGGQLFVEAPTGIGKTISVLYPAVLSLEKEHNEKIFYVTAKNSGSESAVKACDLLLEKGANISYLVITAKEKISFMPKASCNPDECPFAIGYYDKIRTVLYESLSKYHKFDRETILKIAQEYQICPFELQLDLASYVDIVICDYNYVFDPLVYLKRFFDFDSSQTLLLVDEAHNLVDRSKEMYTAFLHLETYQKVKKSKVTTKEPKIQKAINKLGKQLQTLMKEWSETTLIPLANDLIINLNKFIVEGQTFMKDKPEKVNDEFKDFFFEANRFLKIFEFMNDKFCSYIDKDIRKGAVVIRCLDSSAIIQNLIRPLKGVIYFTATFSPINYFLKSLGGNENTPFLRLQSPFPVDNLCLIVAPKISTKFKKRVDSLTEVADYIRFLVTSKIGNYLIFFPSYKYLGEVAEYFKEEEAFNLLIQESKMTNLQQEQFLACFQEKPTRTTVGFAVLGGAFNEGIDLVEDRLIGLAIIGVGLPQLSFERNLMKDYFNTLDLDGYLYSYAYPGMNKVMQAVGRLIRSETDRGVALLIDDRYLERRYREMFKNEWQNYEVALSKEDLSDVIKQFWLKSNNNYDD